jgi:hypothetical protein
LSQGEDAWIASGCKSNARLYIIEIMQKLQLSADRRGLNINKEKKKSLEKNMSNPEPSVWS